MGSYFTPAMILEIVVQYVGPMFQNRVGVGGINKLKAGVTGGFKN